LSGLSAFQDKEGDHAMIKEWINKIMNRRPVDRPEYVARHRYVPIKPVTKDNPTDETKRGAK
jgi:hypothetical protein